MIITIPQISFFFITLFLSVVFNLFLAFYKAPVKKKINVDRKFALGDILVSSRGVMCTIIGIPHSTNLTYAYQYKDGLIHIRKQSEVEDGRFSLLIDKKV